MVGTNTNIVNNHSFFKYVKPDKYDLLLFAIAWGLGAIVMMRSYMSSYPLDISLLLFLSIFLRSPLILLNVFVFIPTFFNRSKFFLYFIILLISCALLFPFSNLFLGYFAPDYPQFVNGKLWSFTINEAQNITIFSSFFLGKHYLQFRDRMQTVEKEKVQTELDYLKAQINPHFYFNTLNNLYGLALVKSDRTPDAILKLSKIMEYLIYDCKNDQIQLKKEIDYLRNYVELERLRLEETAKVKFLVEGLANGTVIAPLILLPLIENAFKHGSYNEERTYEIIIKISIDPASEKVQLVVKNTYDPNQTKKGGSGIPNFQKRLNLLYPQKHQLTLDTSTGFHIATLELETS